MPPTPEPEAATTPSSAFEQLHPLMQRWIWDKGWTSLRDAQERAIAPILIGDRDVIIAAATAAGKTEAAFLPILSSLVTARDKAVSPRKDPWLVHSPWTEPEAEVPSGVQVLCISPLKALINDQFQRLEQLCERADIAVHRWHGDVSGSLKQKVLKNPSGVLLITPESLEAILVNRGTRVPGLFADLRYIVIDELHSFLSTPRGAQLQSLISRVELAIQRQAPRVGLSATLGDMAQARTFLRPSDANKVVVIESKTDDKAWKLQLRGYMATLPTISPTQAQQHKNRGHDVDIEDLVRGDARLISKHLFRTLRGQDNLVFANARAAVEQYADLLARRSQKERIPNEFWPHHGNLAKNVRETAEAQLKDRTQPSTAVCTSTLEMGIDIGTVVSVAQIGTPPSVASLRQRLGRSGRHESEPSVLRLYISEKHLDHRSGVLDRLRCSLVQTIAMVRLMLDKWLEAPEDPGFNYSTLIQQILSVIAQHSGASAKQLHRTLCGAGPFERVDQARFARLLRVMASHDLLEQASDGILLHGAVGERHVNHYNFYTAFQTSDEWQIIASDKRLGTIPIVQPLYEGVLLIFAGKRWKVKSVDVDSRIVEVQRFSAGSPPSFFAGKGAAVADRVRQEMAAVYQTNENYVWINRQATQLLTEGRTAYTQLRLAETPIVHDDSDLLILPWTGDRALFTAAIALQSQHIDTQVEGPAIRLIQTDIKQVTDAMHRLLDSKPPQPEELAAIIDNRRIDKWDWALDDALLNESAGARRLDIKSAWKMLERITQNLKSQTGTNHSPKP